MTCFTIIKAKFGGVSTFECCHLSTYRSILSNFYNIVLGALLAAIQNPGARG